MGISDVKQFLPILLRAMIRDLRKLTNTMSSFLYSPPPPAARGVAITISPHLARPYAEELLIFPLHLSALLHELSKSFWLQLKHFALLSHWGRQYSEDIGW